MNVTDILDRAQFVVDAGGTKKSVLLDYTTGEALLTLLEDLEDIEEIRHLRDAGKEVIPWEQAKVELQVDRSF